MTQSNQTQSDISQREAHLLAPYAMFSEQSQGRVYSEANHPYRGAFQRDRDRIVHSAAYRRLTHKTQVFTGEPGDYHRNRLTHTLEVSSVARTLARALRLNEDLVEALSLAHDIGHPPFGHAGEDTLNECLQQEGGFNHNAQALRIFEHLELRYSSFPGLNLSHEVLAGQRTRVEKDHTQRRPLLEVQVVDAADSAAYDTHDADDALQLGLLTLDELLEIPLWREAATRVREKLGQMSEPLLIKAILHELLDWQVSDLLTVAHQRIEAFAIQNTDDVQQAELIIQPSDELAILKSQLESFLFEHVYRHRRVLSMREQAQQALVDMFEHYVKAPEKLPESYVARIDQFGTNRCVGDYIAGMTDRFAMSSHKSLIQNI